MLDQLAAFLAWAFALPVSLFVFPRFKPSFFHAIRSPPRLGVCFPCLLRLFVCDLKYSPPCQRRKTVHSAVTGPRPKRRLEGSDIFATRSVSNGVSISSFPILKLLTHPEMERPAMREQIDTDRSAGTTICIPKARELTPADRATQSVALIRIPFTPLAKE